MSGDVLTFEPAAQRLTVDREAFRRLCVEAGGAAGALQACETMLRQLGAPAAASDTVRDAAADAKRALDAAISSARPV